jgi:hypothetical protein
VLADAPTGSAHCALLGERAYLVVGRETPARVLLATLLAILRWRG